MPNQSRAKFKHVSKIVKENIEKLQKSECTFSDIYRITFDKKDFVIAETSTAFSGIVEYTYRDAEVIINKLAASILHRTGGIGRFIALYGDNCPEWLFLFWAILRSGNKPFLVNLRQPCSFSQSMMDHLQAEYVVSVNETSLFSQKNLDYDTLLNAESDAELPSCDFADEVAICTSGTTMNEKICIFSGKQISALILESRKIIRMSPRIQKPYRGNIKMLVVLPLYHIFGLEATYLWFSFFGVSFVFPENMSPDVLLRTIREHEVTHILCVPTLWHTIEKTVRREIAKRDEKTQEKFKKGLKLSLTLQSAFPFAEQWIASKLFKEIRNNLFGESVRFCISGGSALKLSSLELMNGIGYPLYNGYGMSEIGIVAANFTKKTKNRISNSFGKPFPYVSFKLSDHGTLLVSGKSVCKYMIIDGVRKDVDEWFDTGDLVEIDKSGNCTIVGRKSDLVIGESGENLNPEVAEKFFELTSAKNYAVVGDDDNQKLRLIVQLSENIVSIQKDKVISDIEKGKRNLPLVYQSIDVFYTYDPIMDENDIKVSRTKLRNKVKNKEIQLFTSLTTQNDGDAYSGEESEVKSIIRSIFADILEVEGSSISDTAHFMNDLGASSLEYMMLVNRINERFDIDIGYESEGFGYSLNDFTRVVEALIIL